MIDARDFDEKKLEEVFVRAYINTADSRSRAIVRLDQLRQAGKTVPSNLFMELFGFVPTGDHING